MIVEIIGDKVVLENGNSLSFSDLYRIINALATNFRDAGKITVYEAGRMRRTASIIDHAVDQIETPT